MRQLFTVLAAVLFWSGVALAQSAPWPKPDEPSATERHAVEQNLKDVHFDFDKYDLTPEAHQILEEDAEWLKANPDVRVSIAGDADERGEIVYNVNLSQ